MPDIISPEAQKALEQKGITVTRKDSAPSNNETGKKKETTPMTTPVITTGFKLPTSPAARAAGEAAFNTNILRRAVEFLRERQEAGCTVTVSVIGRKGRDFFRRRQWNRRQEWTGVFDRLSYEHALDIGGDIVQQFTSGTFDELHIVYNEFKSVIQQRVVVEKLLPIESLDQEAEKLGGGYLFEPAEEELLKVLLPKHIEVQAFHALMESSAAELGARMAAMDGATRNAGEMIKKMTLYYNKTRQAAITKELMDIVGGAEALR